MSTSQLNRSNHDSSAPGRIRIVHLGLGAFHRAHQAWYTQHADDAGEWGIAAFTGRSPDAAVDLSAQDGLYTVVERSENGDHFEVITCILEAHDGADVPRLMELVAAETTAIVTLTVTEAAYNLCLDGTLDLQHPAVASDAELLSKAFAAKDSGALRGTWPTTPAGRLVLALDARRRSGAGGIAVVSCDNVANNGAAARAAVHGMAAAASIPLARWVEQNVSFVSTSVDRITPRTTSEDKDLVARSTGLRDEAPVVTEPFHSWVLSGSFPAGRPLWEAAGAIFVDDIEPFENRKLWLLNGAHSILAYAGQLRGHATVAQAVQDKQCRLFITNFWDEAEAHLRTQGLDVPAYRERLWQRFSNGRIAHQLAQIGTDGLTKLRMRALPVIQAELAAGRSGAGAALLIAAWVANLRHTVAIREAIRDTSARELEEALTLPPGHDTRALLARLDPGLAAGDRVPTMVDGLIDRWWPAPLD